jgi:hypothetical protein
MNEQDRYELLLACIVCHTPLAFKDKLKEEIWTKSFLSLVSGCVCVSCCDVVGVQVETGLDRVSRTSLYSVN